MGRVKQLSFAGAGDAGHFQQRVRTPRMEGEADELGCSIRAGGRWEQGSHQVCGSLALRPALNGQHHGRHLGACQKCRIWGPTLPYEVRICVEQDLQMTRRHINV